MTSTPLFLQFITAARNPRCLIGDGCDKGNAVPFLQTLWNVLRLWALFFAISLGAGIVLSLVLALAEPITHYSVDKEHAVVQLLFQQPWYVLLFFASVWAPLVEELTFRLGLKASPYRLGFALIFLAMLLLSLIRTLFPQLVPAWLISTRTGLGILQFLGIIVIFGGGLGTLFRYVPLLWEKVATWHQKHFALIFYATTISFGLVHSVNFGNFQRIWYLIPLLVLPQLLLGIVLGFIRMHYGLPWSMFYHFFHNTITASSISLVVHQLSEETRKAIENNDIAALVNMPARDEIILLIFGGCILLFGLFMVAAILHLLAEVFLPTKKSQKTV